VLIAAAPGDASGSKHSDHSQRMAALAEQQRGLSKQMEALSSRQQMLGREQTALGDKQAATSRRAEQQAKQLMEEAIAKGLATPVRG